MISDRGLLFGPPCIHNS